MQAFHSPHDAAGPHDDDDTAARRAEIRAGAARTAAQLATMVGHLPLKDLVRETTDVIEKLCIERALAMTGDNRASAADVLGLSRQSLYVKLRRFGLADQNGDEA